MQTANGNFVNGFNIDDDAAKYFNFGSVTQGGGNELYTGVKTIGSPLVADATSEMSPAFKYSASFTARVKARKGGSPNSLQPAEATFNVGTGLSSYGVIMNADE